MIAMYARVSTAEQATCGHSLQQQAAELSAAACRRGGKAKIFQDHGISASIPLERRPAGAQLMDDLPNIKVIMVTRLDRLFRDALDGLAFFREAARHGVSVMALHDHIDTTTAVGRMQLTIQLAAAQYEREIAAERVKACSDRLRQDGRRYGHVPYGLQEHGERMVRDPQTWPVRERILSWRGAGWPYRAIAARLRRDRIPAPNGGREWHASTVSSICKTHADLEHLPALDQPTA